MNLSALTREELEDIVRMQDEALEFYAKCRHFTYCGKEDFEPENPSGEPSNIECGGSEGSEFEFENGGFARTARAKVQRIVEEAEGE